MNGDIITANTITNVIKMVRNQVSDGLDNWELKQPIELDMSFSVSGETDKGLDLKIVKLGSNVESNQIHRIKMSIGPKNEAEEAEKKARVARAIAEEKTSNLISKSC